MGTNFWDYMDEELISLGSLRGDGLEAESVRDLAAELAARLADALDELRALEEEME